MVSLGSLALVSCGLSFDVQEVFGPDDGGPFVGEGGGADAAAIDAQVAPDAPGTDAPVEDVSPIASYYATVSRKLKDGSVFYRDQRMSREEALRSYTIQNAYAAFEENVKGSLKPGKLADITVLSRDILTIPEDEIPQTDVVYTIVGGQIRYENRALAVK